MKNAYHKIISAVLVVGSIAGVSMTSYAKPATRNLLTCRQPDGSQITLRIVGDESFHTFMTEDGFPVVRTAEGYFYAVPNDDTGAPVASAFRVSEQSERSASEMNFLRSVNASDILAKFRNSSKPVLKPTRYTRAASATGRPGLFPGNTFPLTGSPKNLVILVEFSDASFKMSNPKEYYTRMLNEDGFSEDGATGSVRQWLEANSGGSYSPEFDVYGPVKLPESTSYYGKNDRWGNDMHPDEMIISACEAIDSYVDFSEYDTNADGYVDDVYVFYCGYGESDSEFSDTIWPHNYEISATNPDPVIFDGIEVDYYACSNEIDYYTKKTDGIGTFAHEFSHVMGLPDLYATSYTSAFTPQEWSVMDMGCYNNDSHTPPLYSGYERYALGWNNPDEFGVSGKVSLPAYEKDGYCIIAKVPEKETEFFIFENRQNTGYDTFLPGHGMLVWHIDYNESVWEENIVNNSANHQYVDLIEADNSRKTTTLDGDPFPGRKNIKSFTDKTTPAFISWDKHSMNISLTDIAETSDGIITFKLDNPGYVPSKVENIDVDKEIVTVKYVNLQGMTVENPEEGLFVKITEYSDGSHEAGKVLLRK